MGVFSKTRPTNQKPRIPDECFTKRKRSGAGYYRNTNQEIVNPQGIATIIRYNTSMDPDKNPENKIFFYFKEFWPIVVFVGTIIVGWTNINGELRYQEARISALEARSNATDTTLAKMASDVAYIRGKLEGK